MNKTIKFSIPYNGDLALTEWAIESGEVYEVYFSGFFKHDFSDPYEKMEFHSYNEIKSLIDLCKVNNIKTNLLLNRKTMFFEDLSKVRQSIRMLTKAGHIDSVTISDPFMVSFLRKEFPSIELQSSIYMGIDNINKIREALKMGITTFCLDPSLNRNAAELKKAMRLKADYPQLAIKLLGVLTCYTYCFYSGVHNLLSVNRRILETMSLKDKRKSIGYHLNPFKCYYKCRDISDEIKRPFIRPEDITYYEKEQLTDYIKIAYRDEASGLLKEKMASYFNRSYKGDLFHLIDSTKHKDIYCDNKKFPDGFVEKVTQCDKDCLRCGYCGRIAKLCISVK